jgi:hypothetical protein
MRHAVRVFATLSTAALVSACSTQGNTMLVFGQTQTVGISIGGSATDQGISFTLGYQDRNFAIVPASVRQADGGATQVLSTVTSNGTRGRKSEGSDALSVLGQFSVETNSKTADVGLGKFFATGLAAQKLADGFGERLAGPSLEAAAAVEKAKPKATEGSASAPSK